MERHWKYYGTDGNGGFTEGVTRKEYSDMGTALKEEIYKCVHNCLKCEAVGSTRVNFLNTLLNAGYKSCEVCFNIKLKRNGIMKWLEDKKIIKPKTEGFALMIRDSDNVDIISSAEPHNGIINITSTKINGLR